MYRVVKLVDSCEVALFWLHNISFPKISNIQIVYNHSAAEIYLHNYKHVPVTTSATFGLPTIEFLNCESDLERW